MVEHHFSGLVSKLCTSLYALIIILEEEAETEWFSTLLRMWILRWKMLLLDVRLVKLSELHTTKPTATKQRAFTYNCSVILYPKNYKWLYRMVFNLQFSRQPDIILLKIFTLLQIFLEKKGMLFKKSLFLFFCGKMLRKERKRVGLVLVSDFMSSPAKGLATFGHERQKAIYLRLIMWGCLNLKLKQGGGGKSGRKSVLCDTLLLLVEFFFEIVVMWYLGTRNLGTLFE